MFSKYGTYIRKSDSKTIQRYRCGICRSHFSDAVFSNCYNQNKRRLNPVVSKLLTSCVSQRRIAIILGISRTTVKRKLEFLGKKALYDHQTWLFKNKGRFQKIQFDDLETIEHTKLKPVSVTVVIEEPTRKILGFCVSRIPSKGHLAKISVKKYGRRRDESPKNRRVLFKDMTEYISPLAEFETDQHMDYPRILRKYFPQATHQTFKREEACVTGQGELKRKKFDPIFMINHTLAMLRANINRLVRKTWCTTKKLEPLKWHLALYINFHNQILTKN